MNLCPKLLPPRRMLASLCVFALAFLVRAEHIQFSKPTVPIAAPAKEKETLSRDRSKGMNFGDQGFQQPIVSQPQIVRIRPKESADDDEQSDPREPREPIDPSEKYLRQDKNQKSLTRQKTGPNQTKSGDMPKSKRLDGFPSDDSQSLSPVTDFNLDERELGKRSRESLFAGRNSLKTREDSKQQAEKFRPILRDLHEGQGEDSEQEADKFRPMAFFDVIAGRPKETEKPSREILERRAAFEQLLNPSAGIVAKTPGSFEPITALDPPKALMPMAIPAIIGGNVEAKSVKPLPALGFQQDHLQSPMFDGIAAKNSKNLGPVSGPSFDSFQQTPLSRQPGVHEFPARKF